MTQPAKAQEPSMEEILASIRRIIADDEPKPAAAAAPAPAAAKPAAAKPAAPPPAPPPPAAKPAAAKPAPAPAADAGPNNQDDIDALLADFGPDTADTSGDMSAPQEAPAAVEEDVFDLTEAMEVAVKSEFKKIVPHDDLEFAENEALPPPPAAPSPAPVQMEAPPPVAAVAERPLLSASTVSAVDSAFNTLAHTVLSQNARTLEDLVREMLRPMLKSWLDDNLPGLVERLVKAEIERVARGR